MSDNTPIGKFGVMEKVLQKTMRCFVYDMEENLEEQNQLKVFIHVTAEEYSYNRFWFKADGAGDYIRLPEGIAVSSPGEMATDDNHKDGKQYFRISKTRYELLKPERQNIFGQQIPDGRVKNVLEDLLPSVSYKRSDSGTFVKIASGEQVMYTGFGRGQTPSPVMVDITGVARYKKVYERYVFDEPENNKNNKCYNNNMSVTSHVKVPLEFGTHKITNSRYNTKVGNPNPSSKGQTKEILDTLWNYDKNYNKVGYGAGVWFKNFDFSPIGKDKNGKYTEDGDYIEETYNAPDEKDKWSPDSGSTDQPYNVHKLPCSTYKAYFYRGDDPTDKSIANPMNAQEKLEKDIADKKHDLAVKAGGRPIVFEIARYTRTNNFSYYKKGGPIPPNDYPGQPAFYEIRYSNPRFRVVLKEEDYEDNFTKDKMVIQVNPERTVISLDKFTKSNELEGCLGILGVLKNNVYTKLADAKGAWKTFNENLIKIIPELGEVYGYKKSDKIDARTRVFLKADSLPDIPITS
ncbi:MAG: hypothetical protein FWF53_01850 [Candidatus Azobacteroides sp.]|nr:hypothetical protein [Candidatus Azobacteroides sp.]